MAHLSHLCISYNANHVTFVCYFEKAVRIDIHIFSFQGKHVYIIHCWMSLWEFGISIWRINTSSTGLVYNREPDLVIRASLFHASVLVVNDLYLKVSNVFSLTSRHCSKCSTFNNISLDPTICWELMMTNGTPASHLSCACNGWRLKSYQSIHRLIQWNGWCLCDGFS